MGASATPRRSRGSCGWRRWLERLGENRPFTEPFEPSAPTTGSPRSSWRRGCAHSAPSVSPPTTQKTDRDPLVRLGLGYAGPEPPRQVNGHGFIEKAWADVKMQNSLPLEGVVAGLFEQLALGGGERGFAVVDASGGQLPHHRLRCVAILALQQNARL